MSQLLTPFLFPPSMITLVSLSMFRTVHPATVLSDPPRILIAHARDPSNVRDWNWTWETPSRRIIGSRNRDTVTSPVRRLDGGQK